jgi:high-affinity Fe2+/Pb2+ permease
VGTGFLLILALVGLFSAALWIHKRRHTEGDEMDETRELLEDLRDAAAWLFNLWP